MSDLPPPSTPQPPEPPPPAPTPPPTPEPPVAPPEVPEMFSSSGDPLPKSKEEEMLGIVMHAMTLLVLSAFAWIPFLNLIGPALLWVLKRSDSAYLDAHGKEVVNFNIGVSIVTLIGMIPFLGCLMLPLTWLAIIGAAALGVMGVIQASEKKLYRYPANLRLIK